MAKAQSARVDEIAENFILKSIRVFLSVILKIRFRNQERNSRKSGYAPIYMSREQCYAA